MYFGPRTGTPPRGYVCNLCCIEGHWINECPAADAAADAAAALEAAQIDSDSGSSADRVHDFVEAEERRLEQARHSLLTDRRLPLHAV